MHIYRLGAGLSHEEKLVVFERRILRIYGPTRENNVWGIKYNDELYSLNKDHSQSNESSQDKMATTFSENGGILTLQKRNLLPA
jgi:hypothetical protein